MELIQDRLDARNKSRANLFNWRGQFTPDFVDYVLESFCRPNDIVVDPFSGSGTVLLECARKDLRCYGFEINPAAYAMSSFFTFCNLTQSTRLDIISAVEQTISDLSLITQDLPLFTPGQSYRENYHNLLEFARDLFSRVSNRQEAIIALNVLFLAENRKKDNLYSAVAKSLTYVRRILVQLPYAEKSIGANLTDARSIHKDLPAKANVIFTSPPYINVFNYHQNYRAVLETLGCDLLRVAKSEFGSNRKHRGNRFKTVVQYCLDMEDSLKSFWECMVEDGLLILVVGRESNVRKIPFYNGEIVRAIAQGIGCFRDISNFERVFLNKFGANIREEIIILRKDNAPPSLSNARETSRQHLELALSTAPDYAGDDLVDAINSIETINPSPLFSAEGVLPNVQDTS